MTPELIEAAIRLADLLEAENVALAALDLQAAGRMLPAKTAALAAFTAARDRAKASPVPEAVARELADKLGAAAATNQRLLERAITVQGRVLETIARAARVQTALPQYGAHGRPAAVRNASAITFSARA